MTSPRPLMPYIYDIQTEPIWWRLNFEPLVIISFHNCHLFTFVDCVFLIITYFIDNILTIKILFTINSL